MLQSYKTKLKIKNESHLAQKVGFMEVPSYLDIQPNDGFNILLPQVMQPTFRPHRAVRLNGYAYPGTDSASRWCRAVLCRRSWT